MKKTLLCLCCLLCVVLFFTACNQNCIDDITAGPEPTPYYIIDCEDAIPHDYNNLIIDYNKLVSVCLSADFDEAFYNCEDLLDHISLQYMQKGTQVYENWNNMIVEILSNGNKNDVFNYYFTDLNNDGITEAVWQKNNKTILAIFTLVNKKVCLLDAFWSRYKCNIKDENIYIISSGGVTTDFFVKNVQSNSLELKKIQEYSVEETAQGTIYYQIENDIKKEISEVVFYQLTSNFNK